MSDESTQSAGGNPVAGLAEQGNADFTSALNGQENAQTPGQAQTGAAKPRSQLPQKTADEVDANAAEQGTPNAGSKQAPVQQRVPAAPDHNALIRDTVAATAAAITQSQRNQPAPQRQLSPQEQEAQFNQKYRVVRTDPKELAALFDTDPAKAAAFFDNKLQAAVTQALLMAKELGEAGLGNVRSEYGNDIKAWRAYQTEQKERAIEESFYKEHADLADERDLVETVKSDLINRVKSGNLKFSSQQEANKAVAEATRKIVSRMNKTTPDASSQQTNGNARPASQQRQAPAGRQMSAASTAGRSGTGKATALTDADLVFGSEAR